MEQQDHLFTTPRSLTVNTFNAAASHFLLSLLTPAARRRRTIITAEVEEEEVCIFTHCICIIVILYPSICKPIILLCFIHFNYNFATFKTFTKPHCINHEFFVNIFLITGNGDKSNNNSEKCAHVNLDWREFRAKLYRDELVINSLLNTISNLHVPLFKWIESTS